MTGWTEIDRDCLAGGSELVLYERAGEHMIRADGLELMTTEAVRSEEAFVQFGLEACETEPENVLIGGLGLGYTLAAACSALPSAHIQVAELSEAVIRWFKGPARNANTELLVLPKVDLVRSDVMHVLKDPSEQADLILLDVDNGPEALVQKGNEGLYSVDGIRAAAESLNDGGALVYWSAFEAPWFSDRLEKAGLCVTAHHYPLPANPRIEHVHYVATA